LLMPQSTAGSPLLYEQPEPGLAGGPRHQILLELRGHREPDLLLLLGAIGARLMLKPPVTAVDPGGLEARLGQGSDTCGATHSSSSHVGAQFIRQ
jgi:hypothetical protein